jgi:hypothetical protein
MGGYEDPTEMNDTEDRTMNTTIISMDVTSLL